jgi:hypothetical protein
MSFQGLKRVWGVSGPNYSLAFNKREDAIKHIYYKYIHEGKITPVDPEFLNGRGLDDLYGLLGEIDGNFSISEVILGNQPPNSPAEVKWGICSSAVAKIMKEEENNLSDNFASSCSLNF